jgi:hypothetical protein
MRFTSIFAVAIAGLSAIVSAAAIADTSSTSTGDNPIHAPIANTVVTAGSKFDITWTKGAAKFVDIILRRGNSSSLDEVEVICSKSQKEKPWKILNSSLTSTIAVNPNSGLYYWVPSKDLVGADDYSIEIKDTNDDSVVNYSAKFTIVSNGKGISSTSSSSKATATASASKTSKTASASGSGVASASASATGTDEPASSASGASPAEVSTFTGAAGKVQLGSWATMGAAAMFGMIAGGALVL